MKLKNLTYNFYFSLIFLISIFSIDRISKLYVINLSEKINESELFSSKFLNIILIWNEGIAFGLLSFNHNHLYNLLTIVILFIALVVLVMIIKSTSFKKYSLIMILGGALGNVYDRILYRAVPDFIDFHIEDFHWFIFNIADIFITIGVIFMILYELIDNNYTKNHEKN
jgi:signal peptidase II